MCFEHHQKINIQKWMCIRKGNVLRATQLVSLSHMVHLCRIKGGLFLHFLAVYSSYLSCLPVLNYAYLSAICYVLPSAGELSLTKPIALIQQMTLYSKISSRSMFGVGMCVLPVYASVYS